MGTFQNPSTSSSRCAESISEGWSGAAASMKGKANVGSTSSATVTTSSAG